MPLDNGQFELRIVALEAEINRLRAELQAVRERKEAPYIYQFPSKYVCDHPLTTTWPGKQGQHNK